MPQGIGAGGHCATLIGSPRRATIAPVETARGTVLDARKPESRKRSDRSRPPDQGSQDISGDRRSRIAIGAHAILISVAAGAVTSLLSGLISAF